MYNFIHCSEKFQKDFIILPKKQHFINIFKTIFVHNKDKYTFTCKNILMIPQLLIKKIIFLI